MGVMDNMKFWKKKDDFNFDEFLKRGDSPEKDPFSSQPQTEPSAFSIPPVQQLSPSPYQPVPSPPNTDKEMELLNSKLDTIKAILNSIDQRLSHLERTTGTEKKERLW